MSDDCIQVPRDLNENELSLCSRLHPGGKCFWRGFRLEFLVQPFEVRLPVFLVSFSTLNRSRRKEVRPFSLCSIVKCSSCSITSDNSAYVFSLGERSESMHFESLGQSYKDQAQAIGRFKVCVPLEWSGSGSVIQDLSGSCASKEPTNPLWPWIHRFLWIASWSRQILDHWSGSRSPQRKAPLDSQVVNPVEFELSPWSWFSNFWSDRAN